MLSLKHFNLISNNNFYVIAEIGINHNGNIKLAKDLIDSAVRAGANAVKFQTYISEKRVKKNSPIFDILKKCELSHAEFKELYKYSKQKKIEFFSTPFDEESFYFLESLGVRLFKIASFDVTNLKLIDIISNSKKTIILSTGMSTLKEVEQAFNIFKNKKSKLILLHCVSSYPISEDEANLLVIKKLKEKFNCLVGYSDHTNDIKTSLYSACMGAQVIEKHFMIDKRMNCVDKSVSITEKQLNKLNLELDNLDKILGSGKKTITNAEKKNIIFKRKIKI